MTAPEATELTEKYIRLAFKIANRWAANHPHLHDEFESAAVFTLWQSALGFDQARDVHFSTWFRLQCRSALIRVLRKERAKAPEMFIPQFVPTEKQETHPAERIADPRRGPAEAAEIALDAAPLLRALDALPERQRDVVQRRVMLNQKFDEIAAAHGMSRANIGNILNAALDSIKANHMA
ncbi:MAG: sigma-70 family RNA polymerase sigma factor [Planctomycetes bacterium]|nr:sigma-70 family RNA polymerase sigma factor [Planctomycetota bacterium]